MIRKTTTIHVATLSLLLFVTGCNSAIGGDPFCKAMEGSWVSHTKSFAMFGAPSEYDLFWTVRRDGGVYVLEATGRSDGHPLDGQGTSGACANGVFTKGSMSYPVTYTESDDTIRYSHYVLKRVK